MNNMKIVQVINTMIANSSKISNVIKGKDTEYYFLYDDKYKWSICESSEEAGFRLYFYPTEEYSLEQLANTILTMPNVNFVGYSSMEIKTTEALESFGELYQVVIGKLYNIDSIFDEIIKSDPNYINFEQVLL